MAITVINDVVDNGAAKNRYEQAGITTGNEFIYAVNPFKTYIVEGVVTSAGEAQAYSLANVAEPTDFTDMVADPAGSYNSSFSREVSGQSWIGVDVVSGTWTVTIAEI